MPFSAGDRVGPYAVVSAIGKGGMGEVWKARGPRLGRHVAIEVSAPQFTDRYGTRSAGDRRTWSPPGFARIGSVNESSTNDSRPGGM
jgi:serine/threonine protein kinase